MDAQNLPPDDPSGSITVLYQQWRQGNPDSLNQLIARYWPQLLVGKGGRNVAGTDGSRSSPGVAL